MIRKNWVLVSLPPAVFTVIRTSLVCPAGSGGVRLVGTVTSMWVSPGVPSGANSAVAPSNLTVTGGHPKLVPLSRILCPAGPFGGKGAAGGDFGPGTPRAARDVGGRGGPPPPP